MNYKKYRPLTDFKYPKRTWPDKKLVKAPVWCSTDLRDGNQALEQPMSIEEKLRYFTFLVDMGFKEIEVSFPSASNTELAFVRALIEKDLIPDGVSIQALTISREDCIEKTFEALEGVKSAIVHLYVATSPLHRNAVFKMSKEEVTELAEYGAKKIKEYAAKYGSERFRFEFSPETFTSTEMDFSLEICNKVIDIFEPSPDKKLIINLPATVEISGANVYADQIEYMNDNLKKRDCLEISLHTHNDRGCAVAATELALLAGADRVEGTLFGNGERTGNLDIVTVALNLYTHGIDPMLKLDNINEAVNAYKAASKMTLHPRHPYAGELVYTAFSGTHQDAIKKGMSALKPGYEYWEMPYLPIDPADVGRSYEAIIRINSQSGKSGVAYVLETEYGIKMPKAMQIHFGGIATKASDAGKSELPSKDIYALFLKEYINISAPLNLVKYAETTNGKTFVEADITYLSDTKSVKGSGNGILDAFANALCQEFSIEFDIKEYSEHSLGQGSDSKAITYINIDSKGVMFFGAGVDSNISKSSLQALVSAVNKLMCTACTNEMTG